MLQVKFYAAIMKAIDDGLLEIFGPATARAVEFYVDPSIASTDMVQYTKLLQKIFGEGSKIVEDKVAEKLYSNLHLQFQKIENYRLWDYVVEAKKTQNL